MEVVMMAEEPIDRYPLRTLAFLLAAGSFLFVALLFAVHMTMVLASMNSDPSIVNFYPVMGLIGALFGFERWWACEQGPVNPFHESRYY